MCQLVGFKSAGRQTLLPLGRPVSLFPVFMQRQSDKMLVLAFIWWYRRESDMYPPIKLWKEMNKYISQNVKLFP